VVAVTHMTNPYNAYEAGVRVQESAREWSKLQLGALGFVGICGVLRGDSGSGRPLWLQDLSGIAALLGLILALVAVTLVATAAFPLAAVPVRPESAARRLRLGIAVTFVAVACTALSAMTMWWPDRGSTKAANAGEQVTVTTSSGTACGTVLDSAGGSVDLEVNGERVRLPLNRLQSIKPVDAC
jgi:hypothetical protein